MVALPCGRDEQGTPFGLQLVGAMYQDHALLSMARALEQAFRVDPVLARPQPDLDELSRSASQCRTLGRSVHGASGTG